MSVETTGSAVPMRSLLRSRTVRIGLGAVGLAAGWLVLGAVFGSSSASASDAPPADGGTSSSLLGAVGSTVQSLDPALESVTGTLDEVVTGVTDAVVPPVVETATTELVDPAVTEIVEPVAPLLPDPVADVAGAVVEAIPEATDAAVGGVVEGVGDLAGAEPVAGITDPIAGEADQVVADLGAVVPEGPVVAGVLGSTPVGSVLSPVVDLADTVVGGAAGAVLPTVGSIAEQVTDPVTPIGDAVGGADPSVPAIPVIPGTDGSVDGTAPGHAGIDAASPDDPASLPVAAAPDAGVVPGATMSRGASGGAPGSAEAGPGRAVPGMTATGSGSAGGAGAAPGGGSPFPFPLPGGPTGPGSAPASSGGSGSAGGGSGSAGAAATMNSTAAGILPAASIGSTGVPADEDLPSSPVHDTDTSPD